MSKLTRALATCRRVLLLLLFGIVLFGGWAYSQMPKLDALRPSIESYLKQELQLDTLQLGKLSWYWAGFLWIESDKLSFETSNHAIAYKNGRISVRVPLFKLLIAEIAPDSIRLNGGRLELKLAGGDARPAIPAAFPGHLVLDDVDLAWQYGDLGGRLPGLRLFVDGNSRSLKLRSADLQLYLQLDDDMLPHALRLTCSGNSWLPSAWQPLLGMPAGELRLFRNRPTQWTLETELKRPQGTTIRLAKDFSLPLTQLTARLELTGGRDKPDAPFRLTAASLHELHWQQESNDITASGSWQQGMLTLDAQASQLAMPLIWSWLKPFGEADWQAWLARMQHGLATDAKAHIELPWQQPLAGLPTGRELAAVRYRVTGKVDDADIALGLASADELTGTAADIELDESGLHAHVRQAMLPLDIGQASGELLLPWNTLELNINGTAKVDAARLGAWQAPELLDGTQWQQAASHVNFMLRWTPPQAEPTEATVVLQPESEWQLNVGGLPVIASGGTLQWDKQKGLSMNSMQVRTPHMLGKLSIAASRNAAGLWQVDSAAADITSDFATLAEHFELPVGGATGSLQTRLSYDGQWHGNLDLTDAGWDNLLGSAKPAGRAYHVELTGSADAGSPFGNIHIDRIDSSGDALELHGSGRITPEGLNLKLDRIKSTFFDGGMQIRAPFGPSVPWELDVNAALLYRKALPTELSSATTTTKPWALRANIDHFIWNEASLSGVSIQLASSEGSVGVIEAKQIHTAQTDLMNVRSMFALPGGGRIDLRHLSADVEKQQISLSATLEPATDGGMHWQGFAEISGDFGHLMHEGKLSDRFTGGQMHALFSGRGIVMREQPWWQGLDGRLRLRVDNGHIQEGGSLTKLLAAFNLADLPKLLTGQRPDLAGPGLMYDRLQMEGIIDGKNIAIRNVVLRSAAFDLAGRGKLDVKAGTIDLLIIARPLQNLDALLSKIPLLRDILGGAAHSLMRKVYRMHGQFSDATVESVDPQQVGLASPGLVESLLNLPQLWFGSQKPGQPSTTQ